MSIQLVTKWAEKDLLALITLVNLHGLKDGCKQASIDLNRSVESCTWKYEHTKPRLKGPMRTINNPIVTSKPVVKAEDRSRKFWSKIEENTLRECITTHGVPNGCREAVKILPGRTYMGCSTKWHRYLSGKPSVVTKTPAVVKPEPKIVEIQEEVQEEIKFIPKKGIRQITVKLHTDVTVEAEIISHTDSMIIAKHGDIVVTIEL